MKITSFNNAETASLSFKRAPSPVKRREEGAPVETVELEHAIKDAKNYLGIENLALIMHGSSFPIADKDLFIGSPINKKSKEVNNLLRMYGFDSVQLGPPGMLQRDDHSPYVSSVYSRNFLFTDMEKFTTSEYGKLLKPIDIERFTNKQYINNSKQTDFERAFEAYDELYDTAYTNMHKFSANGNQEAKDMLIEFNLFKKENKEHLESDAIFEILSSKVNDSDDFEKWNDLDQNLMTYVKDKNSPMHDKAVAYKKELMKDYAKEIDVYLFEQFVVKKQEKEFAKTDDKLNYMSDAIIGFSPRDVWANKEAFLENYRVGCPYGGKGKAVNWSTWGENQAWDIPFVDPKKLFNEDGSIGVGGKLIQEKFRSLLENHQSIRIDHVLGLVDPWVYDKRRLDIKKDDKGNIYETTAYGANVSKFGKPNAHKITGYDDEQEQWRRVNADIEKMPVIDPDGTYKRLIHEILLPVFKENVLKPSDAAWENLGCPTDVFNEVCYGNEGNRPDGDNREIIPGMSSLKSYKAQDQARKVPDNTFLIQSHDDSHTGQLLTNEFYEGNKKDVMDPMYLIGTLYPDYSEEKKKPLFNRLENDTDFRTVTKWQELIRFGKNVQVTFTDFFGLPDRYNDYNNPSDPNNWKMRLSKDYKKEYYETLERAKHDDGKDPTWWSHIPMNMPEIFKRAVISKTLNEGKSLESVKDLTDKLDYYEKVLYEKES